MAKQIPLTQGKFAIVDDDDFERVNQYKWHANKKYDLKYKVIYLGYFGTQEEAAIAYNEASEKHHGEHGLKNVIGEKE